MPTEREPRNIDETKDSELSMVQDWLKRAENASAETEHRKGSIEDYKFYAGKQDTDEDVIELNSKNRPTSTFNEIKPKIDMLIGMAAQTKHEPVVLPVGPEDEPLAELIHKALVFFHKQLSISDKEIDCFEHTVKSGRSLLHFYIDTSNPFEPQIKCRRFAGDKFWLDPDGVELDLSDHRFLFMEKWVTKEDLKVKWPGVDPAEIEQWSSRSADTLQFFNEVEDKYRIIEAWYRKWIEVVYFINPLTQKVEFLTPEKFNKFVLAIQEGIRHPETDEVVYQNDAGLAGQKSHKQVMFHIIFSANKKLAGGQSTHNWEDFPTVLFGAYKDDDFNNWFGPVSMMKDPQKSLNTMRRQLVHLLQTLPKGLMIHEIGTIVNIDEYEKRIADPTYHLTVNKGGIEKVKFEKQPSISPIYQVLDAVFQQGMKDASGIQDPMMGISEGTREPGVTRRMKQETGIAVLFLLFYNFQKSRIRTSKLLLSLLQQYIKMPRIIRVEGPEGMQLMEINSQMNPESGGFNDISAGKYDIFVDESVESASIRMNVAQILTDFSHNNPDTIPPDIILEYMDVPFTTKQKVKLYREQQQALQQQQADREFQLQKEELEIKRIAANKKPTTKKE